MELTIAYRTLNRLVWLQKSGCRAYQLRPASFIPAYAYFLFPCRWDAAFIIFSKR